jgi:BMFP domain-containing protein YqiC
MENQTTTNTGTDRADEAAAAGRAAKLGALLKTRFAGVKAQLDASQARAREKIGQSKLGSVQDKVKGALQSAVGKVKSGLDLPSRTEVSSLAQRIEELDKKLADYETRTASGKGKKKDTGDKTDWA